ncbi:MAG: hypothetical protein KatS3mg077_0522 [Candidatus Binatia bacterium]|nr:MAG: hypothetical protein KatS3mg077_0522 [Candidatus Binatia bacterium]
MRPDVERAEAMKWRAKLQVAVTATALVYFGVLQFFGVNLGEEGATVFLLYRTARGEIPYVDFISGYTPGYFYFHAALFRLLGEHLSVVRTALVVVHTANVALLFRIAAQIVSPAWALVTALAYPALLPVVEASELSFNVPYPAWYCIALFLVGWLLAARAVAERRAVLWLVAGVLSGVAFSFKPNSGLFQLAFSVVAATGPLVGVVPRVRAGILAVVAAGAMLLFRYHLTATTIAVFVGPFLVALGAWARSGGDAGGEPRSSREAFRPVLLVALGFGLITLPWLFLFGQWLGAERLWREVLFIGSGYEQHFFIAYDWDWRFFGGALLVAALARWWPRTEFARRHQRWSSVSLAACGTAALAYVVAAPKPEGLLASIVSAVQKSAFVLLPVGHWIASFDAWRNQERGPLSGIRHEWVLLVLGAEMLFWTAYPRSDFFHLVYAAPLSFVVLARLAENYSNDWGRLVGDLSGRWGPRTTASLAASVLLACALPQLRLWAQIVAFFGGLPAELEWWDTERAAVLVRHDQAGQRQRNFAAAAQWIRKHSTAGDYLFTFPDLDLLGFLARSRHPARIGYFKSGWPGHAVEAEVVDRLEQQPPRYIVTEFPPSLFFYDAAAFFFLLRDWVERRYVIVHRIGSFRIWAPADPAHRGGPAVSNSLEERGSGGAETRIGRLCDRRAVRALRWSGDPVAVRHWAEEWAREGYLRWDVGCSRLVLRIVGEQGDAVAARALATARVPVTSSLYPDWAGALWNVALRSLLLRWQLGGLGDSARWPEHAGEIKVAHWLDWFEREHDPRLRLYLAWSIATYADTHAIERALETIWNPTASSAWILERAILMSRLQGVASEWAGLISQASSGDVLLVALFLDWAKEHPREATAAIEEVLRAEKPCARETGAYLSAVLPEVGVCGVLDELAQGDPDPRVRKASCWAARRAGCTGRCTLESVSG